MRVAVVTHAARKIGGTETYIEALLPALESAGHRTAAVFESDGDLTRPPIRIASQMQCWSVQDHGPDVALLRLMSWAPDVLYVHGLGSVDLEARIQRIAPSVFYAHNFYGQCISGSKCYRHPSRATCTRTFGPACLAHYFPRGCGGRNPVQMLKDYQLQAARLQLLHRYVRVLTNSNYLATEFSRHSIQAQCVPLFVSKLPLEPPAIGKFALPVDRDPWRLLFLGRAEPLKGGDLLLEALPIAARKIDRPISLTVAADGPALSEWKQIAQGIRNDRIDIEFVGWSSRTGELFSKSHLLVMPSVWPEPFGLSGIEAGSYAVPAVAYAIGGIPEWLHEAENGHVAPADPPTAKNFAIAITSALSDENHYLRLRANALVRAREFSLLRHMDSLLSVFQQLVRPAYTPQAVKVAAR
jgi:glycosyltransferase involved in cell wall biosynthesis